MFVISYNVYTLRHQSVMCLSPPGRMSLNTFGNILLWTSCFNRLLTFFAFWLQATSFYKLVAERGPWSSLSRWALEAYLKGDVGKALILYSRMAEMGYEVAQSNAAWILDKYGERSMCMGASGFCTDKERHERAHSLWWRASEQGNEHAALLIGDAYYYGRVSLPSI